MSEIRNPSATTSTLDTVEMEPLKNLTVCLYITNTGKHIVRVPTEAKPGVIFNGGGKTLVMELLFHFPDNPLGIKVRVADSKLGVVDLHPGQTAILVFQVCCNESKYDKFVVYYEVAKDFAALNGLWSGRLVTESVPIKKGGVR